LSWFESNTHNNMHGAKVKLLKHISVVLYKKENSLKESILN